MRDRDFSNESESGSPRDLYDEDPEREPPDDPERDHPQRPDEFVVRLPGYRDEL